MRTSSAAGPARPFPDHTRVKDAPDFAGKNPATRSAFRISRGFTLIELLVVIAIMSILVGLSGPMVSSLSGANTVDKAATDLSNLLQQARAYAMANDTYVRVGFGTTPNASFSPVPAFVVLCLYSSDGSLSATTQWNTAGIPLILNNFNFSDSLGPSTDVTPDTTNLPSFTRMVGDLGSVTFQAIIQFSPSGTAQVSSSAPARYIKVPVDRPTPQNGKNPFIIRLEGLTGATQILRS